MHSRKHFNVHRKQNFTMSFDDYEDDFEFDDRDATGSKKTSAPVAVSTAKPSWLADASESFDLPVDDDIFGTKSKTPAPSRPTTSRYVN